MGDIIKIIGSTINGLFLFTFGSILGFAAATALFFYFGEEGMKELGETAVERFQNWKSSKW